MSAGAVIKPSMTATEIANNWKANSEYLPPPSGPTVDAACDALKAWEGCMSMVKPRIQWAGYLCMWACRGNGVSCVGFTPEYAYRHWKSLFPEPPTAPENRIEYVGFMTRYIGPESGLEAWRAQPWWRRVLTSRTEWTGPR